ncbi:SigE family RNA polymerase sigma factor [Nocardioides daphniae]|uniref:RNA polymerase n=1 Tax=Nocardioides daphniae TaxID=402297 RepID=A0A4P7UDY1_9ACTN|nr:SigE family RNA polymerase sigma factor [Nocardioides daphniae]QCC78483.1 SigE family RNA polymerase sigma factor [Nocardioides daphniae]GGD12042.1 RNA polymerase [Nocardioides daphniae]
MEGTMRGSPTGVDFEAFAADVWPRIYRAAYLLTGQHADAEDLAQQTLLQAHQAWGMVSAADSPTAYVRRMLTNAFISGRRSRARRPERLTDEVDDAETSRSPGGDAVVDVDERASLWPHVLALPPRQRAVVVLRYYEGLSEREIADALGCAPGTVKASAHRALRSLRATLDAESASESGSESASESLTEGKEA